MLIVDQSSNEEFDPINCPVFTKNPFEDDDLASKMIDAVKPCGTYWSLGCHHDVIRAGIDYPGEGPGELGFQPYIVQFDIGVNKNIKDRVMADSKNSGEGHECIGCTPGEDGTPNEGGEQCIELIVKGNSDVNGGCAGKCGGGCILGAGWAKDCLKHDVVSISFDFLYFQ